jgi:hypothetical protein
MVTAGINSATNADRRGFNVIDHGKIEPETKVRPVVQAAFEAVMQRYQAVIQ